MAVGVLRALGVPDEKIAARSPADGRCSNGNLAPRTLGVPDEKKWALSRPTFGRVPGEGRHFSRLGSCR